MRTAIRILAAILAPMSAMSAPSSTRTPLSAEHSPTSAARDVLRRLVGGRVDSVRMEMLQAEQGRDVYEYEAHGGTLTVRGSSGVALCRGFYDYLKANHLGMVTWNGARLELPPRWPEVAKHHVSTPFEKRFYFNVVTYGYTTPYWDWPRWEKELDWMALHGMNFPLALVGTEAIAERVWKQIGLTQPEIDAFYTGPAHLPWQRMGNIIKHDGPLPASWHQDQLALQHKILNRMKELGITPIVPGFAGFVPRGLKRINPEAQLHELSWAGFPEEKRAWMLSPSHPLFQKIGKMFIEEWEKEFGKCQYYLVDSFNEMQLPETGQSKTELLAEYGDAIYRSIQAGNPDAVWVIQGWMLGYQRDIWNKQTVAALLRKVPNDRMLILDEACDYNAHFWHNGMNWEQFGAYDGKPWIYGVIPNMGGKTAYTGVLDFYANDIFKALNSPQKGRLVGYGFAPEGIENNEVIYELMGDNAWRITPPDLDLWLKEYCESRYGGCPDAMKSAWQLFQKSCYSNLKDHPKFGWQQGACSYGSVNRDPRFVDGVQQFLSCAGTLGKSPLYQADAIEQASMVLGLKADSWFVLARQSFDSGALETYSKASARGLELLSQADRLLESHPINRLERWLNFACSHGTNDVQKRYYESNARRLITVWGPPINDYSCRVWSGLIRDFYRERMARYFDSLKTGTAFNRGAWEEEWVRGSGVSSIEPFAEPVAMAVKLVTEACAEPFPKIKELSSESLGEWNPKDVSTTWQTVEWQMSSEQLKKMKGVQFKHTGGKHRLDIEWVALIADGKEVARETHFGYAGTPNNANTYHLKVPAGSQANNSCLIRAKVRSDGGNDSRGRVLLLAGDQ